jgi:hypothetical protein
VFRQTEAGKIAFVLAAYVAPGVRRRLPVEQRKLTTPELRARFAKGAAAQMIRSHARERTPNGNAAGGRASDPTALTFDEFARLWTSGRLAEMYPGHVRAKTSVDPDIQRLDFMKPLVGDVPLREFRVEHAEKVLAALPQGFSRLNPSPLRPDASPRPHARVLPRQGP